MRLPHLIASVLAVAVLAGCSPAPGSAAGASPAQADPATFRGSGFAACPAPAGAAFPGDDALPQLTLPCMDGGGEAYALARPSGRPVVLNLWGSWCPPCGEELPAFQRLHTDAHGKLTVLGVVTEDSANGSVVAARELGVTFANVYDREGKVRRALGRNALPVTLFVDAGARVRHVYNGVPLDDAALRALVQKHLGVVVS